MKKFLFLLCLLAAHRGYAQLLTEDFNFTGNLSANGWTLYESADDPLAVTNGLTYSINTDIVYPLSGNGVCIRRLPTTAGQDAYKTFTAQTTPGKAVFVSFLIRLTDTLFTAKTGNYVLHLGYKDSIAPLSVGSMLYVRQHSNGGIQFGVSNSSSVQYTAAFPAERNYLLVMKYTLANAPGGVNQVKLWVLYGGAMTDLETDYPAILTHTTTAASGNANIKVNLLGLRQNNNTNNVVPEVLIDSIRVDTAWPGKYAASSSCSKNVYVGDAAAPWAWDSIAAQASRGSAEAQKHINLRPAWKNLYDSNATYCPVPYLPASGKLLALSGMPTTPRFALTGKVWPVQPGDASICLWEDDKVAAVSHSIDDNLANEVADWMQINRNYGGLKITWNLITGNIGGAIDPTRVNQTGTWAFWKNVVDSGFQVQSHTVTHVADPVRQDGWPGPNWEFELSRDQIDANIPGYKTKLVAYPGSGIPQFNLSANWYPAVPKYMAAARGVSTNPPINIANMTNYTSIATTSNPTQFISDSPAVVPFRAILDTTGLPAAYHKYYRGWATVFIHSIQGAGTNLAGSPNAIIASFARVFDFFNQHRDSLWIGFLADVALYGQERDMGSVQTILRSDTAIHLLLTSQMDPAIFDYPLTIKVRVSNSWSQVSATQNGDTLPASMILHADSNYVLVKARPDHGLIILKQPGASRPASLTLKEKQAKKLLLAPNPATDHLAVTLPYPATDHAVLQVVSVSGNILSSKRVQKGLLQSAIETGSLQEGVYLLVYRNGADIASAKFVKQLAYRR
jgi:Secretion system C-terminal sorting domain